jgi:hypothetical protein
MITIKNIVKVDATDEEYLKIKRFSNSKLSLLNPDEEGSKEKFLKGDTTINKNSNIVGDLIHLILLQKNRTISDFEISSLKVKEIFDLALTYMDSTNIEEIVNRAVQEIKYYKGKPGLKRLQKLYDEFKIYHKYLFLNRRDENCIVLDKRNKKVINSILANVNDEILNLIDDYENNETTFLLEIVTKNARFLPFKCRIDSFKIDHINKEVLVTDLKTTSNLTNDFKGISEYESSDVPFSLNGSIKLKDGSFQKYRYNRQIAFYTEVLRQYLIKQDEKYKDYTFKCNIVAICTYEDKPFMRILPITQEELTDGLNEFNKLVNMIP